MSITCNGHPINPGVVLSSPHGHYVSKAVIETALGLGWEDDDAADAVESYDDNYFDQSWRHFEYWYDMVDDAERWLNDNTEGGVWHWFDGDFRVDTDEDYGNEWAE